MSARRPIAALFAAALVLAACGGSDSTANGPVVDVFGPYRGAEADALADSVGALERDAGIDVRYVGSADFVVDLQNRLVGDEQPDIAIVPQPGLVRLLDDLDLLVPHGDATQALLDDGARFVDLGVDAVDVALPYRTTIKSLVWYRPEVFSDNGWSVPRTLLELERFVDQISATTDIAPWCFSIASGAASGWPATDWVEDIVLRLHGPEVYDDWSDGVIEFGDERIVEAFELVDRLLLEDGAVVGGRRALLQTDVIEAGLPLFDDDPGCAMYKQASFALDWFPGSPSVGPDGDVDAFVLPGLDADTPAPLVVGGDHVVAFDDRAEVDRTVARLLDGGADSELTGDDGYLSGRVDLLADARSPSARRLAEVLGEERTTRFDASDAMDPRFGTDVIWSAMVTWMSAADTLRGVLDGLDEQRAALDGSAGGDD